MKTSELWSVNVRDFVKGASVALISAVAAFLGESFTKGNFILDYTAIWHTAAAAFVGYVIHRLGSPATVPVDSVKAPANLNQQQ